MNNFLSLVIIITLLIQSATYTSEMPTIEDNIKEEINIIDVPSGDVISEIDIVEEEKIEWKIAKVTAYCPCTKCCGPNSNGLTASGIVAKPNHTIAMSKNYPFSTEIEIENMGIYTVEDRGGAITNDRIDIYFSSHSEALSFGVKTLRFRVIQK